MIENFGGVRWIQLERVRKQGSSQGTFLKVDCLPSLHGHSNGKRYFNFRCLVRGWSYAWFFPFEKYNIHFRQPSTVGPVVERAKAPYRFCGFHGPSVRISLAASYLSTPLVAALIFNWFLLIICYLNFDLVIKRNSKMGWNVSFY